MTTLPLNLHEELNRCFGKVEIGENDGRHGIGAPWLVARGLTRELPIANPRHLYIGERHPSRFRRFYCHPSGWVVEGGRGGARLFYAAGEPHPYISAFSPTSTRVRTRSIRDAVAIVEALTVPAPWWRRWFR